MRVLPYLAPLAVIATLALLPHSAAQPSAETIYEVEVDRLDGIESLDDLEDEALTRARAIIEAAGGKPLPDAKQLTKRLAAEFGSAELDEEATGYIWLLNPVTGIWERVCIDTATILVAPDDDPNPIVVRLKATVLLD